MSGRKPRYVVQTRFESANYTSPEWVDDFRVTRKREMVSVEHDSLGAAYDSACDEAPSLKPERVSVRIVERVGDGERVVHGPHLAGLYRETPPAIGEIAS